MRFQEMLWHKTAAFTKEISPFYIPEFWIPHITLINGTNDRNNLLCALNKLLTKNCVWELKVDTLALIGDPNEDGFGGQYIYKFGKG